MTKKEVIKALEGLDDDAQVMIKIDDEWESGGRYYNVDSVDEKVVGDKLQNEITFYCK